MTSKSKSIRYKIDWQTDQLKISHYQLGTIKSRCRLAFLVIEFEFLENKNAKADLQQEYFSVECIPYLSDLDPDAMTLALNLDLDIVKAYMYTGNELPSFSSSKVTDWTDSDTRVHRQADITEIITYPHTHVVKINGCKTKMHSSKMRTVHCSGRWGGGSCIPACRGGGVCLGGLPSGGCLPGGVCARGCLPPPWRDTLPCEQNHRRLWKHNLTATMLRTAIRHNTTTRYVSTISIL